MPLKSARTVLLCVLLMVVVTTLSYSGYLVTGPYWLYRSVSMAFDALKLAAIVGSLVWIGHVARRETDSRAALTVLVLAASIVALVAAYLLNRGVFGALASARLLGQLVVDGRSPDPSLSWAFLGRKALEAVAYALPFAVWRAVQGPRASRVRTPEAPARA